MHLIADGCGRTKLIPEQELVSGFLIHLSADGCSDARCKCQSLSFATSAKVNNYTLPLLLCGLERGGGATLG